jgi:prevent-host-death family protein
METVSLVDFRKNAAKILGRLRQGHSLVLTSRGHPVARLEPVPVEKAREDDPLYRLFEVAADEGGGVLSNAEMDRLIYGV